MHSCILNCTNHICHFYLYLLGLGKRFTQLSYARDGIAPFLGSQHVPFNVKQQSEHCDLVIVFWLLKEIGFFFYIFFFLILQYLMSKLAIEDFPSFNPSIYVCMRYVSNIIQKQSHFLYQYNDLNNLLKNKTELGRIYMRLVRSNSYYLIIERIQ